jgi:Cu/Zn superoxide dismutase
MHNRMTGDEMKHARIAVSVLAAGLAAFALAACGGSSDDETEAVSGQVESLAGAPGGDRDVTGEATLERTDGGTTVSLNLTGLEPDKAYVAHLHTGGCDQADPGGPHFKFDAEGGDEPPNEIHLEFRSKADGAASASAASNREVPAGEAGSVVIHEAGTEHTTAGEAGGGAETVLVHEGHHHGEEPAAPVKIACAELEGGHAHDSSGEEAASRGGKVPTVTIRNGEAVGGIADLEYSAGEDVRFEVTSDVADEVHVHGYDLMEEVPAGGTVSFDFPAEIEGIFEVELEGRKTQIAELTVNP